MKSLFLLAAALILINATQTELWKGVPMYVSANAFHEYCGRCHALPDVRATEPPESMYNYVRAFGATDSDIDEIREYVEYVRSDLTSPDADAEGGSVDHNN